MNTEESGEIVTLVDKDGKKHTISAVETKRGDEGGPYQDNRAVPYLTRHCL